MALSRTLTIGQFIPRDSPVHRLDPRTKILAATALMVVVFLVGDFTGFAGLALFILALYAAARIPPVYLWTGLRPILFLLALTFLLNLFFSGVRDGTPLVRIGPVMVTTEALTRAAFVATRLVLLVVTASLFTFTTSPMSLTDGMERMLRPLRRLGVPGHELAMMMSIALRFIPTLVEEAERIVKAQMARGAEFRRGGVLRRARAMLPVLVPLFVSAFRRADELALAMEARAYRGGEGRTRMKELRFGLRDAAAGLLTLLVGAAVLASRLGLL